MIGHIILSYSVSKKALELPNSTSVSQNKKDYEVFNYRLEEMIETSRLSVEIRSAIVTLCRVNMSLKTIAKRWKAIGLNELFKRPRRPKETTKMNDFSFGVMSKRDITAPEI